MAGTKQEFMDLGFNAWVSNALSEREVSLEEVKHLSGYEIMQHVLEWNGIIGYTQDIIEAVDNLHSMRD